MPKGLVQESFVHHSALVVWNECLSTAYKHDTCAICHEAFSASVPDICRVLDCAHVFHARCVDIWFIKATFCPLCKSDLKSTYRNTSSQRSLGRSSQTSSHRSLGSRSQSSSLRSGQILVGHSNSDPALLRELHRENPAHQQLLHQPHSAGLLHRGSPPTTPDRSIASLAISFSDRSLHEHLATVMGSSRSERSVGILSSSSSGALPAVQEVSDETRAADDLPRSGPPSPLLGSPASQEEETGGDTGAHPPEERCSRGQPPHHPVRPRVSPWVVGPRAREASQQNRQREVGATNNSGFVDTAAAEATRATTNEAQDRVTLHSQPPRAAPAVRASRTMLGISVARGRGGQLAAAAIHRGWQAGAAPPMTSPVVLPPSRERSELQDIRYGASIRSARSLSLPPADGLPQGRSTGSGTVSPSNCWCPRASTPPSSAASLSSAATPGVSTASPCVPTTAGTAGLLQSLSPGVGGATMAPFIQGTAPACSPLVRCMTNAGETSVVLRAMTHRSGGQNFVTNTGWGGSNAEAIHTRQRLAPSAAITANHLSMRAS